MGARALSTKGCRLYLCPTPLGLSYLSDLAAAVALPWFKTSASAKACATSLEIEFIFDHSQPAREGDSKGEPALRCQVNSHGRCAATACTQDPAMAISYFPGWSFHIRHDLF